MADYNIQSVSFTMTLGNTVLEIGDDDIMLGSVTLDDSSSTAVDFQLGTAIAKKLSFELNNFDDRFSDYDFSGAVINAKLAYSVGNVLNATGATVDGNNLMELPNASVDANNNLGGAAGTMSSGNTVRMEDGIVTDTGATIDSNGILTFGDGTLSNRDIIGINGGVMEVPVGVFYVVEKPIYNGGTIAFTAYDCICLTDKVWATDLSFPTTLQKLYDEICEICDVPHQNVPIPNGDYVVNAKPSTDTITCADMLCYISQLCGGFAHTDVDGNLCIMQYGGVLHTLDESFTSEMDTDDITITGVSAIECFDETDTAVAGYYVAGDAGYVLPIAENPLVQQGDAQRAATYVYSVVRGMQFRPMRLTIPKDPTIHAGDALIFIDRNGNQFSAYATSVYFCTNDTTTVVMDAKSPAEHSAVNYSSATKTMSEVRRLTGTDAIFDKIYARGINADYINAGTITGRAINNGNGTFLVDESGNLTATNANVSGNITGSTINGGTITGTTITGGTVTGSTITGGTVTGSTITGGTVTGSTITGGTVTGTTITGGTVTGTSINNGNGTFEVDSAGNMKASAATITGGSMTVTTSEDTAVVKLTSANGYSEVMSNGFRFVRYASSQNITAVYQMLGQNLYLRTYAGNVVNSWGSATPTTYCLLTPSSLTLYDGVNSALYDTNLYATISKLSSTGTITTGTTGAVGMSNGVWTNLASVSHGTGKYVITATCTIASNTSGYRLLIVTSSNSSTTPITTQARTRIAPVNGSATAFGCSTIIDATSSGTWYIRAYQNSGATLSSSESEIRIIKISN